MSVMDSTQRYKLNSSTSKCCGTHPQLQGVCAFSMLMLKNARHFWHAESEAFINSLRKQKCQ